MVNKRSAGLLAACALLIGCAEEEPPPSVDDYLVDRILLEAAMVRCSRDRSTTKYEPECVNAREAANRIAKEEEAERRAALEAQSERKRRALRRAQEAAEEARRRAEELERQRREAEYLAQFGALPDDAAAPTDAGDAGLQTGDAPAADPEPAGDLESIREELKRRQDTAGDDPR